MTRRLLMGFLLLAIAGCGDDDAGPEDAGETAWDAATPDAGDPENDAGPADGGPVDQGVDGGPVATCAGRSALFCEDFEELPLGETTSERWDATGNGSLAIVDDRVFAGDQALHVHTDENGVAFMRVPFSPPGNSFFGRMRVYVTEFPSAPNWAHFTLVELRGTDRPARVRPVGGQFVPEANGGPGAFWGIGADGGPTGDWTNWRLSAPAEGGRWLCVEWTMDASSDFIRLAIDGEDDDALTVDRSDHGGNDVDFVFPTFEQVFLGWQLYQGSPSPAAYDLWIDDVIFDTERVGCD